MANEYLSLQRFPGDGVTTDFTVNFAGGTLDQDQGTAPYLNIDHVRAYEIIPATSETNSVRVRREREVLGPVTFRVSPPVPEGHTLEISRWTPNLNTEVDFQQLQVVSEYDLDVTSRQLLYIVQEAIDRSNLAGVAAEDGWMIAQQALAEATASMARANAAYALAAQADGKASSALTQLANVLSIAEEGLDTATEALHLARLALELAGGFAQVITLFEDTVLTEDLVGRWLRMQAPLSSSVRRLIIPDRNDWPPFGEVILEQDGAGYALVEAEPGVTLRTQPGTAPVIRNGQAVACLKWMGSGEWVLFGALEDL